MRAAAGEGDLPPMTGDCFCPAGKQHLNRVRAHRPEHQQNRRGPVPAGNQITREFIGDTIGQTRQAILKILPETGLAPLYVHVWLRHWRCQITG